MKQTLSPEQKSSILAAAKNLSNGDVSTITAAGKMGGQIGTSKTSPNAAFLSQLIPLGIVEELPLEVEVPDGLPPETFASLTSYQIKPDAVSVVIGLLKEARPDLAASIDAFMARPLEENEKEGQ